MIAYDRDAMGPEGVMLPPPPPEREEPPHPAEQQRTERALPDAPHDIEAEQCVLGSILLDNDHIFAAMEILKPPDFYREPHRRVFRAMEELSKRNEPIDMITLGDELTKMGELKLIGGPAGLQELFEGVPSPGNIVKYASIVRDTARDRRLIEAAKGIIRAATERRGDPAERHAAAERDIFAATLGKRDGEGLVMVRDTIKTVFATIEAVSLKGSEITGIRTGFDKLDRLTCGYQPGDLVIVAGRPGSGKSSLVMDMAAEVVMPERSNAAPRPVAVFEMEMSKEALVQRMFSNKSNVPHKRLRSGRLENADWNLLARAADRIHQAPLAIDDTAGQTITDIRSKARRFKVQHGDLGMVVVDYLQLMQGTGKEGTREEEISGISRGLKALAKELKCPVVALSQLNRGLERRDDKRPVMSDLRESGAIEQDADLILFAYRPIMYEKEANPEDAEIIIGKQRAGDVATIKVTFRKDFLRFENAPLEPGEQDELI